MYPNIDIHELVDDLKFFWGWSLEYHASIPDHDMANEVVSRYTDDPLNYSDGSPVGTEYLSDDPENIVRFQAFKPPHRRSSSYKPEETDS